MIEYFKCRDGCTDCCAKADNNIVSIVTIGDAYRTFQKYQDTDKPFSEICKENFDLYVFNFINMLRARVRGGVSVVPTGGMGAQIESPDLYTISFGSKKPCRHLQDRGCAVHGQIQKYLDCITMPESELRSDIADFQFVRTRYPCFDHGLRLPEKVSKVLGELEIISQKELRITEEVMPGVMVPGNEGKECIAVTRLTDPEGLAKKFWTYFQMFDNPSNRTWSDVIETHSKRMKELLKELYKN